MCGHTSQKNSEGDKSQIAVDHSRTWFVLEIEVSNRAGRAFMLVFREQKKRSPRRQSRSVRQQLADRDHRLVSAIELGQVEREGSIEHQLGHVDAASVQRTGNYRS